MKSLFASHILCAEILIVYQFRECITLLIFFHAEIYTGCNQPIHVQSGPIILRIIQSRDQ